MSDSYTWTVDAASNNYGCLAIAVDPVGGGPHYELCTGITTYVKPAEPPHYNAANPTYLRKQLEEENKQRKHDYFIWKGASRGMAENLRDAMEPQYLEHSIVGYKNVTVLQIMKHLDTEWVPMNTKERRAIMKDYYKLWDRAGRVALSAFTKALDERKTELHVYNVTIDRGSTPRLPQKYLFFCGRPTEKASREGQRRLPNRIMRMSLRWWNFDSP